MPFRFTAARDGVQLAPYPLVNEFYAVIHKSEPENSPARILRDWLLTDEGRHLLIDANYLPAY